jgi:hypothetical protein
MIEHIARFPRLRDWAIFVGNSQDVVGDRFGPDLPPIRDQAGRRMDYASSDTDTIAEAIAAELGRTVDYRPVETDGAARAASLIAELL